MRVTVLLEHRFERTPDGRVWTQTMFPHSYWRRYLSVFDAVQVVARTRCVDTMPDDYQRVDGDGVAVCAVPYYVGPAEYVRKRRQVRAALNQALHSRDAVILRVSSQLANCVAGGLIRSGRPFGVEVVCDPWRVFAPRVIRHPLRLWLRHRFTRLLRRQCRYAAAAAYVTRETLQAQYPAGPQAFSTHYSSVELPPSAFAAGPREDFPEHGPLRIVTVGSLAVPYKGVHVLMAAVAHAAEQGSNLELVIVGDGRCRADLERQAAATGCADRISFRGQLSAGAAVRAELDRAHLFALASQEEGLPRAMIEAMARGLPCLGTSVGGIPELLAADDLVPADAVAQLSGKIQAVARDPARWRAMSARNWQQAFAYGDEQLQQRRNAFCQALAAATRRWCEHTSSCSAQRRVCHGTL